MDDENNLEKCGICNVTVMSGEEAIKHKKTQHSESSFKCNVCGESFLQVTKLLKHIDEAHHISLLCGICQFEASDESTMLNHLDCHRTPGRPFSCQFCQSKFRSKRELSLHVLKHTDNAPFVCNICQKGFKWKQVLKMHMVTHSTDVFHLCPICGFSSKHKSIMVTHQNRHLGRTFSCPEPHCKFTTARKQNLREHQKHHYKMTMFSCPDCPKKFSHKKNLNRHSTVHNPVPSCSPKTETKKIILQEPAHNVQSLDKSVLSCGDTPPSINDPSPNHHRKNGQNKDGSIHIKSEQSIVKKEGNIMEITETDGAPLMKTNEQESKLDAKVVKSSEFVKQGICIDAFKYVNPPNVTVTQSSLRFGNANSTISDALYKMGFPTYGTWTLMPAKECSLSLDKLVMETEKELTDDVLDQRTDGASLKTKTVDLPNTNICQLPNLSPIDIAEVLSLP